MAFDYSVKFQAIDKISDAVNKINSTIKKMKDKAQVASTAVSGAILKIKQSAVNLQDTLGEVNKKLKSIGEKGEETFKKSKGAIVGAVGFLAPLGKALGAYQDIARAKGEIASLGIDDAGIKSIAKSAMDFSSVWAGTTTADFIRASYDIKSGIATLSDTDVGKFTALAGMTAMATKATTAEMTKLYALGHGIFREQFTSDIQFGEQFSSAISQSVKAFRTDGADLISGLSTLGASATSMGVSLQEQLSVLGMSKTAFNTASEAATSYRAFLNGAVNAQEDLGLSFVDSKGKLLPMADIMDKIKNKVEKLGFTMQDANIQQALKKAFGSDEAMKMISALVNKTDDLRKSQKDIADAMLQGTKVTEEMAKAMQQGKEFELLQQKIQNASAVIGGLFAPYALKVADIVGRVTDKIKNWTETNPELTSTIVKWVGIIGAILAVLATLSILIGVVGMSIGSLSVIITVATTIMSLFNMALWANPITWVVIGIIALIAIVGALIYYWKDLTTWVGTLWDEFIGFISPLQNVGNEISNMTDKFINFINSYSGISGTLSGIISLFDLMIAPIKFVIDLIDTFLNKFEIYNQTKQKIQDLANTVETQVGNSWQDAKQFLGFSDSANTTQKPNDVQIDNTNKNHTIVDVNIKLDAGVVTEQNAQSTGGRVKLNTASNGV